MITNIQKAREWAEWAGKRRGVVELHANALAAAEVIQSLPDQWIDAEKVREEADRMDKGAENSMKPGHNEFSRGYAEAMQECAEHLRNLLTPPLPTLADMDEDDRHALVGKDMKVEGWNNPSMLVAVHKDEGAVLGHSWVNPWPFVEVRPLSDLAPVAAPEQGAENTPSLSLSGESEPVSVETEDVTEESRTALPRPEDVPAGEAWLIAYEGGFHTALKADSRDGEPWVASFVPDGGFLWLSDRDVTLIARLVPEVKP